MTSLRRTVEGWMGDDLYRKLGDEPDIDITWKLLRELIGQQLFGSEYVTVPYIESAVYYNQLFLFIKKKNGLGSNPGEGMDVCKCIVALRHLGTLKSGRASSPLMRLVEDEDRWEDSDHSQGVQLENWGRAGSSSFATSDKNGKYCFCLQSKTL
ncbi:uncharacterized protein TNCV_3533681 [Trichonephila clavipes]|nr:uncharacterized protein TNCV_3533681 [Trichonephila clavipes]